MVEQSAWRRNEQVESPAQAARLGFHPHTTEDDSTPES
jgi:hypothetical protein